MEAYRQKKGKWGESVAADFLAARGFDILERNYRSRFGEIDIIASKEEVIHFIEVKTRRGKDWGYPLEAITPGKLGHIRRTAQFYLYCNALEDAEVSIDGLGICGGEIDFVEGISM